MQYLIFLSLKYGHENNRSVYICERTFSTMKIKLRSNQTDVHLHSLPRISTLSCNKWFQTTLIEQKFLINFT